MEEKIAVHCKTEDEWNGVVSELKLNKSGYKWGDSCGTTCISTDGSGYGSISIQEEDGYKIISAADYLKEGDVSEFKVGDRVESKESINHIKKGQRGTIMHTGDRDLAYVDWDIKHECNNISCPYTRKNHGYNVDFHKIKLIVTQTTKENDMKENNINKNVQAVFSNKSGEELLLVDKHYDRDMMDRILMETHKVAILKACKAAEAELIEADRKDK